MGALIAEEVTLGRGQISALSVGVHSAAGGLKFCARKHCVEHSGREASGLCVLLTDVKAAHQDEAADRDDGAVREARSRPRMRGANTGEVLEASAPGDGAEREHDAQVRQEGDFSVEEGGTVGDLVGSRKIAWRRAAYRRNDVGISKHETVVARDAGWLAG